MTEEPEEASPNEAVALAKSLHPMLAGHRPEVVGAALADLTSLLLAGHFGETHAATARLREKLLAEHIKAIRRLIPLQEAMIKTRTTAPPPKPH